MKILSKEPEKVVYRERFHVDDLKCDICKRSIPAHSYKNDESKYFKVTTGHNDWGNDSCDSIEHYDICPNCIGEFVSKYTQEADGSEYLELNTEHFYKSDYEYD